MNTQCRIFHVAFSLVLAGLLSACGSRISLKPLAPDAVVLAFGDSLTYGSGAEREEAYPVVLAQLIGRKVINAGVPGEVTSEGIIRLPAVLEQYHPALMILCHGGNDLLHNLGELQTADNIRAMIRLARERGTEVVLVAVPRPGLLLSPPKFYAEIAREFGLPFEGDILPAILSRGGLKSDVIHPNAEGNRKLAEAIAALFREEKAIP